MKRRDFVAAVGAVVAWPFVARARQRERSQNAGGLEEAKRRFRLVGKWSSPRHDYLYPSDGSWTMLPADEGTTHGTWRIERNQFLRLLVLARLTRLSTRSSSSQKRICNR
jgi:hypothetical protein